jgi:hypothetical protein
MSKQKPSIKKNRQNPNMFASSAGKPSTRPKKGKYRNIMRVGGRRVSAAPPNKVKYDFPVEIRYIEAGTNGIQ